MISPFNPPVLTEEHWFPFTKPCRPKILIVTDGSLNFYANDGFGLWRFLEAITVGVTPRPILTLAHRGASGGSITVGTETYTVITGFNFATAKPAVNRTNYDQIWLFGFDASSPGIDNAQVAVIAAFMNAGGGLFATGDHATIGRAMGGRLPRVRRMREWVSVPMGSEGDLNLAVARNDTVVDPGADKIYQFEDQGDAIPQRIYPAYKVTASGVAPGWRARLHTLLMAPGAPTFRVDGAGFQFDIDVLPDHPHESQCYEVTSPALLNATYTEAGQNFEEFRPGASVAGRIGVEIVAHAVSGGRSVANKPPVRPKMFGAISAYDGRLAQPYAGQTQRPGRIVCDSTWHHFVNVNLDGRGSGRSGLGVWSGGPGVGTFAPSPALQMIYAYFRNTVRWLQPANRVNCKLFWYLTAVRFHPSLREELLDVRADSGWRDLALLGREAARLASEDGVDLADLVTGALVGAPELAPLADFLAGDETAAGDVDPGELTEALTGALLVRVAEITPPDDPKALSAGLERGAERLSAALGEVAPQVLRLGFEHYAGRARRTLTAVDVGTRLLSGPTKPAPTPTPGPVRPRETKTDKV